MQKSEKTVGNKGKNRFRILVDKEVKYYKSHIWCSFALAVIACILALLMIVMIYMKRQYYTYLVDTAYATENALLDSVSENLDIQLENYVDIGVNLSVSENLPRSIMEFIDSKRDVGSYRRIKNSLRLAADTSALIAGIAVADSDGILCQYDKNEMNGDKAIWRTTDEEKIKDVFQKITILGNGETVPRYKIITQPMVHPKLSKKGIIHIAYPLRRGYTYKNVECMLVVSYYNQSLCGLLSQLNKNQEQYIQGYIEDENGKILLHTGGRKYVEMDADTYKNNKNLTDLSRNVEKHGWKLHAVIDKKMLQKKVNSAYNNMLFLYFVAIVLILLILFFAINRILRPVKMISSSISRVKCGNRKEQIPILGTNEIWQLANEYNEMLQSIRKAEQKVEEQHEQVMEFLKMKQRAEREALESQINAHFICNTLNAINYEAMDSGDYKVSILLKKLSNILRYTFNQKHQNVYMFQEISWIEQYLFLQKERMDQEFDYEISFDSDYDNWPCRKLMLQPFVENSIVHGFEGRDKGRFIRIKGEGYKEFLKISIEDNGCGMSEKQKTIIKEILQNPLMAKEKGMGIGISNVITRMKMYYGEEFQVFLETEEGRGTCFSFILPMPCKGAAEEKEIKYENFNRRG